MSMGIEPIATPRYKEVSAGKHGGVAYTPKILADFVAARIVQHYSPPKYGCLRILDPAVGHGELLVSLLERLDEGEGLNRLGSIEVHGFETDPEAIRVTTERLRCFSSNVSLHFERKNFLDFVMENFGLNGSDDLFQGGPPDAYNLIIANPPYVRTQIMGASASQSLARQFGLSGRVDLYYAFILSISEVLDPGGVAGIIVSNRFMSTKSGTPVRRVLSDRFDIFHAWDLGDTKLFDAAVLPAVLLAGGKNQNLSDIHKPNFTSIYESNSPADGKASDPIAALNGHGVVAVEDGRHFNVRHGKLDLSGDPSEVWRMITEKGDSWLSTVEAHSWGSFGGIGKIRVGVKTCADKVFIRDDWQDFPDTDRPELLRPIVTHHVADSFKPIELERPKQIIYPHEVAGGNRRAVDLSDYPKSLAYLQANRSVLEGRSYVLEAGRQWYEIWVPQDPQAWGRMKLVFRDICQTPAFWIDTEGSVVNGDCYWLVSDDPERTDLIWLAAAVGNSTFIEHFYDLRFNNKLYAGRRRFITQYVEKFPLPDPGSPVGRAIIEKANRIYNLARCDEADAYKKELDAMVWEAFGLTG